ncbi:subtilisin-like protein [Mycena alexandri]|uniref:Subtilisin-like protein n=1 Tax=Mycena alexandri TaxID=1745969 RepID=A0AAD6T3D1_9AGAR|nr:subtilisin-like protein [Mycena alexandri]
MVLRKFLTSVLLATSTSAGKLVLHETRSTAPSGFVSHGPAPPGDLLTLRVALTSNHVAGLEEKLTLLATPGSPEFRQWLSMAEAPFVKPSPKTVSAFRTFTSRNNLTSTVISPNEDWVSISLPVSRANQLFGAQFELFSHPSLANNLTRTLSVSLPSELVGHVDVIHPTTAFHYPKTRRLRPVKSDRQLEKRAGSGSPPGSCNTSIPSNVMTPACLQALYGIPTAPATQPNNTILVTGYVSQWPETIDLAVFLETFRPDIPANTTFTLVTLDNGTDPQTPTAGGIEADLDVEYTIGKSPSVQIFRFLSVGGSKFGSGFMMDILDTTTYLDSLADADLPTVMTTSYEETETAFGISLATKICNNYMALGSRGMSIMFSSGDAGVRGDDGICTDNTFTPLFPASCPWATAIGSTIGFGPEIAVNFTGGGFSNFFPSPSYQTTQVAGFLETLPMEFEGIFNSTGRGYPDVAVQGWQFSIVVDETVFPESGTSLSTPTFAGIIALINDQLIAAGKPVLGFLNPFLYSNPTAFTDITIGYNQGGFCPVTAPAFNATAGWDPLTGSGTPLFAELLATALA